MVKKKKSAVRKKKQESAPEDSALSLEEADAKARQKEVRTLKKVLKKCINSDGDFDLDVLNESEIQIFMKSVIGYIFEAYSMSSVFYNGLEYRNHKNQWYFPEHLDLPHDPAVECKGYDQCEFEKGRELARFQPEKGKKIKYLIESKDFNEDPELFPTLSVIDDVFSSYLRILHAKRLILLNDIFNEDHRGSDHTRVILDFPGRVEFRKKETEMDDFIDALFRLKSHKFENWYEMYSEAEVRLDEKSIRVTVIFNNGS